AARPHPRGLAPIAARGAGRLARPHRRPSSGPSARFCTPAESTPKFESVTAQRVRLNITEATDGPTIWEFQLFE
ncbi:MAG: hypothetical protein ACYC3X_31370, partial [Pirellulaceae bacterium]